MANNFKQIIDGAVYVSKAGNDSNAGTAEQSKGSIGAAMSAKSNCPYVVGAGVYYESINAYSTQSSASIIGDGKVVIIPNGQFRISYAATSVKNIEIRNATITGSFSFSSCILKDCSINTESCSFNDCTFINCNFVHNSNLSYNFYNCIFLSSDVYYGNNYVNCYADPQTNIYCSSTCKLQNCDIEGSITATAGDVAYNISNVLAANPSMTVTGCFSSDPKFNNIGFFDFTLQADSPLIGKGNITYSANITGQTVATPLPAADKTIWQTLTNLVVANGTDLQIAQGATSGTATSVPINLGGKTILNIPYHGLQIFDKDQPGGSSLNNNVPNAKVWASADVSGNGNPDRLKFEMRWCTNMEQPQSDADWDNKVSGSALFAAGSWKLFEFDAQPFVDNQGNTSCEAAFNASIKMPIGAYWIQIRVTITNQYN